MNQFFYETEGGEDILITSAIEQTEEGEDILIAPAMQETEAVTLVDAAEAKTMDLGNAGITAVLGYGVVFAGLAMLLAVIAITGAIFKASSKRKAAKSAAEAPAPAAPAVEAKTAPGTGGEVKLFDVPDKEAAMIMAIVADKLKKPLNELRFISIKEVK